MISRAASRAADLTGKLLAFARKGKYLSLPVNLHAVIADVVGLLEHSLDKRIAVRQVLSAHPPVTQGDATQLQSVLLNIALNARDAMPDGGVLEFATRPAELDREDISRRFPELTPGRYVCVTVSDTGIGMSDEVRAHLFEPFFTTKKEGKGTGLGLAAVYGAVGNHNGAVRVTSASGRGTVFHLYLPALDVEVEKERGERPDVIVKGKGSVLVVDDEENVRAVAAAMLETLGYTVRACESGAGAIEEYQRRVGQIDLVLLDMIMPQMGGREAFAALKRIHPGVRVILSSGYTLEGEAQALMKDGILDFIQKPYRMSELSQKIASCLSRNR